MSADVMVRAMFHTVLEPGAKAQNASNKFFAKY
jgi:hypothetical protein